MYIIKKGLRIILFTFCIIISMWLLFDTGLVFNNKDTKDASASLIKIDTNYGSNRLNNRLDRISFIISKMKPSLDPNICRIIGNVADKYCILYKLDLTLVLALIYIESSFDILSTSKKECVGLMQVNPEAHQDKVKGLKYNELYHVDNNVRIGCWILSDYIKSSKTIRYALGKYNGSQRNGYSSKVLHTKGHIQKLING